MSMWLRVASALPFVAVTAAAQTSGVVDEGSFTFTRGGASNGTESFKIIRRLGAEGVEFVAQGTRTLEGRIIRTSLVSDSMGNPTSYTRNATGAGSGQLLARRALNRLTVNEEGPRASSRDYVFTPGTLILDEDVIHLLYFVTWRDARQLAFVAPGGKLAGQATLSELGTENVVIGSATIPATHFSLGTGDDKREIWIDSSKRLLRVSQPAKQLVVTRDLPPR